MSRNCAKFVAAKIPNHDGDKVSRASIRIVRSVPHIKARSGRDKNLAVPFYVRARHAGKYTYLAECFILCGRNRQV